jgi:hypothetical protein
VLFLTWASSAWALINPNYTPVDLINQSQTIVRVELTVGEGGRLEIGDHKNLKGQAPDELALEIDRTSPTVARHLANAVDKDKKSALLFLGDFSAASSGAAPAGGGDTLLGLLHVDVTWFALKLEGKKLVLADDKLDMKAVWAGSNAMLEQIVDYVQNDYRADVPVKVGIQWASDLKVADVAGKVHACMAVELFEPGKPCLWILAETGDRLYRAGVDGKLNDVTDQTGLVSKSRCAACGDLDGDGRTDLACSDGSRIEVFYMRHSGGLEAKPVDVELPGECIGLAAIPSGGKTGLLVSTTAMPMLVTPATDNRWNVTQLGEPIEDLGKARPCLAADFDGDGICDVVRPHSSGVWFHKGEPDGFAAAARAGEAALGDSTAAPFLGDFDADGLLDIVVPRPSCCSLLVNLGGGRFRDTLREAGEVEYNSLQSETVAGSWCDLNNDGRQEFVLFSPNVGFQPYFNRGFRCFGYAPEIDAQNTSLSAARAARLGQQAGVVADFNADGGQDLALVTADGQVWILWRDVTKGRKLGVSVSLGAAEPGPINVIGFDGTRCLGAQPVAAGAAGFFCRRTKGPIKLRWQTEPGTWQDRQVIVLGPTQFRLPSGE